MWTVVALEDRGQSPAWDWSVEREVLAMAGAELVVYDCRDQSNIAVALSGADAAIGHVDSITLSALEGATRCRTLVQAAVGFEGVDVAAAARLGIAIAIVPDYCTDEVSDHAMAMLLALARGLTSFEKSVRHGLWEYEAAGRLRRLRGRTLGLYGFGRISRLVAAKAQAFGLRVFAHDPFVDHATMAKAGVKGLDDLEALLVSADYVSIHAPLTPRTKRVFDAAALARMRRGAYLVNVSRGGLIDEDDLLDALQAGHLAGAALDVMADEPPRPDHPLIALDNVLVTPHAAWLSEESLRQRSVLSAEAVIAALEGGMPPHTVNGEDGFPWLEA